MTNSTPATSQPYTPTPWNIEPGGGHAYPCIRGSDVVHTNGRQRDGNGISSASYSDMVCEFPHDLSLPGPQANARLIAAAPELLEALEAIINDTYSDCRKSLAEKAYSAIKKARGE